MFDSDFPARVEMDFSGHACSSFVTCYLFVGKGGGEHVDVTALV